MKIQSGGYFCFVFESGRERGLGNAPFLHCRNCDSLAVVAVVHFDPHLAGRRLVAIRSAEDCSCPL